MPYWSAVLELMTNISGVCCFLYFLIICLFTSFNEFQGVKSCGGHIFSVGFPGEFFINCDSEVLGIFSSFQFDVVKFIWKDDWFLLCFVTQITSHYPD